MERARNPVMRPLLLTMFANAAVVAGGVGLAYWLDHEIIFGLVLILVALITFFAFLMAPGSFEKRGQFNESRIRLAITATLLLVYLVYLGIQIFLSGAPTEFHRQMFPSLTTLLSVTIPFYFGASVAAEIGTAQSTEKPHEQ